MSCSIDVTATLLQLEDQNLFSEDREGVAWEGEVGDQTVEAAGGTSYIPIPQLSLIKCH
jgi:hypothetical protein